MMMILLWSLYCLQSATILNFPTLTMGSVNNGKAGTTSQSQFKMEPQAKHIRYDNKDNKSLRTIKF